MARWGQPGATWDSGLRWDEPDPLPNPKPKRIKRQDWYPSPIGDQVLWLENFDDKLPLHSAGLGIAAPVVTARRLDVANALYAMKDYRSSLGPSTTACYQCIEDALYGADVPGNTGWPGFTAPAGAPAPVANGCLTRIFDFIASFKDTPACTQMIQEDLRIIGPVAVPPSPTVTPDFTLRTTTGGKLEVVWTKRPFDGVKLEFDLGPAGIKSDVDLRPNYTLNWLPAAGASAIIKVRLRYMYKGEDFGNWSPWMTYTITGS